MNRFGFLAPVHSAPIRTHSLLWNSLLVEAARMESSSYFPDIPSGPDEAILERLMHAPVTSGKVEAWTDLFDPFWNSEHTGSARHLSFPPLQFKGAGLSLPTHYVEDETATEPGKLRLPSAIRSFILSYLLDSTLPGGSCLPVSVQGLSDGKNAILMRLLKSPRLANVSPKMSASERSEILDLLQSKFGTSHPQSLQRQLIGTLSTMAYLFGSPQATPDNLLIDGSTIDEETSGWPPVADTMVLKIEVFRAESRMRSHSVFQARNSVKLFHQLFSILYSSEVILAEEECWSLFLEQLTSLTGDASIAEIWDSSPEPNEFTRWMSSLRDRGWETLSTVDLIPGIQGITLHKKIPPRTGLMGEFNRRKRPGLDEFTSKILTLCKDPEEKVDRRRVSEIVLGFAGEHSYLVPCRFLDSGKAVSNSMNWSQFWETTYRKWPSLRNLPVVLKAWDGIREIRVSKEEFPAMDLIPLTLHFPKGIVPAVKTVIVKSVAT